MRECQCKDKGGRLRGKDNGKEDISRRKEEGNSKEKEDKDSSWTCVVGLVDGALPVWWYSWVSIVASHTTIKQG